MSNLTEEAAQRLTGIIRSWVKQYPVVEVRQAWEGRIWVPMGYDSWDEWVDCELDGFPLPKTVDDRRAVVVELHEAGMSNRAIADAIGVGSRTVDRDVASSAPDGADGGRIVTGKDGRKRNVTNIGRRPSEPDEVVPRTEIEIKFAELSAAEREIGDLLSKFSNINPREFDEDQRKYIIGSLQVIQAVAQQVEGFYAECNAEVAA